MQQVETRRRSTESKEAVTFVKFTCDLVSFGLLQVLNEEWRFPHHQSDSRTFHEIVGMAAVVFRHRHAAEFTDSITDCPAYVFEDIEDTLLYLQDFARKIFKGRIPLMEFIVYCAFIVDLTICCYEEGKKEFIVEIVEESYDVFEEYIKQYFHMIGGWHAINQMAEQYLQFVKSVKLYGALESKETRAGIPAGEPCFETVNDNKSDEDDHSHLTSRYSDNDSHSEGAKDDHASDTVNADTNPCASAGRDNSPASETENSPEMDSYTPTVFMRNGLVIPSTVTREDAAIGSEDFNYMELVSTDELFK